MAQFLAFVDGQPMIVNAADIGQATSMLATAYPGAYISVEPLGGRKLPEPPSWRRVGVIVLCLLAAIWVAAVFHL